MAKITVKDTEVTVISIDSEDYICITDMLKAKDGDFFVADWLRNRNTLEYIGIWEQIYNPTFNYPEFAIIKSQAGLNSFRISVKELVDKTNIKCLQARAGRYGGTYAHKDIAFEFSLWISPEFKIYIVREFQRLKREEQKLLGWSAKRELARINYHIHTDAIKHNLIPAELTTQQTSIIYASEADVLNVALFGITAAMWRETNADLKGNIRDHASDMPVEHGKLERGFYKRGALATRTVDKTEPDRHSANKSFAGSRKQKNDEITNLKNN